jgi:enterochelin esterase-like enzyme
MGASLGGLISVYLALKRPDLFSKAASQSGAFLLAQDRILDLAREAPAAQSFYFDVGKYEQRFVPSHVLLVEALNARGCRCFFQELAGGHNWTSWRAHLKDLLVFLWPDGSAGPPKRAARRRRKQR